MDQDVGYIWRLAQHTELNYIAISFHQRHAYTQRQNQGEPEQTRQRGR